MSHHRSRGGGPKGWGGGSGEAFFLLCNTQVNQSECSVWLTFYC